MAQGFQKGRLGSSGVAASPVQGLPLRSPTAEQIRETLLVHRECLSLSCAGISANWLKERGLRGAHCAGVA